MGTRTWPCSENMAMCHQHTHGHVPRTWPCATNMAMYSEHGHVPWAMYRATCPCPLNMAMCREHGHVLQTWPCSGCPHILVILVILVIFIILILESSYSSPQFFVNGEFIAVHPILRQWRMRRHAPNSSLMANSPTYI